MNRFHPSMSWMQAPPDRDEVDGDEADDLEALLNHFEGRHPDTPPIWNSARPRVAAHRHFFLPVHYTASYQYPLVIWLHNDGFNESQVNHVMPHVSVRNFVAAGIRRTRSADSSGHGFDWHDSPAAIALAHDAVVQTAEEASQRYSIHHERIVLVGYGRGGTMAMRIAMREPQRFAAVASLGGRMPSGSIRNLNELRARKLPTLWQWASGNVEYTAENLKTDCQSVMTLGNKVEIRQYPGEDEMDTVVLADLNQWIMNNVVSLQPSDEAQRWATSPTSYSSN